MLPVATAPNAIAYAYSQGRLHVRRMAVAGIVLNIFGIILTSILSAIFVPLIF